MDPITIGVVGVVVLVALGLKKSAPSVAAKTPVAPTAPVATGNVAADFVNTVKSVGGIAPALAVVKLGGEAYLAAKVGAAATGDKGTGLFGQLLGEKGHVNPAIVATEVISIATQLPNGGAGAYAFNGGRVVGRELDQALGGDGQTGTGTIAQVGVGTTALLASVGSIAAVAFFWVTALAYAIGSIVSDVNRLAYGQSGAAKDYDAEWWRIYHRTAEALRQSAPGVSEAEVDRVASPYTDGFMRHKNQLAFLGWARRGRGLFVGLGSAGDEYHAKFGHERGYFYGGLSGSVLSVHPYERSLSDSYYMTSFGVPMREVTNDPFRKVIYRMGVIASNLNAYYDWMINEPHGAFVDDQGHFNAGLSQGRYEGALGGPGGHLRYDSCRNGPAGEMIFEIKHYNWKEEQLRRQNMGAA